MTIEGNRDVGWQRRSRQTDLAPALRFAAAVPAGVHLGFAWMAGIVAAALLLISRDHHAVCDGWPTRLSPVSGKGEEP